MYPSCAYVTEHVYTRFANKAEGQTRNQDFILGGEGLKKLLRSPHKIRTFNGVTNCV